MKIFNLYLDTMILIGFLNGWVEYGFLILKNIKRDSKRHNLSFLSILYNSLIKYPILGFLPIDFFCYRLYKNNYKEYISYIEFYSKLIRRSFYFSDSIGNKFFFKKSIMKKIRTPKLIAYYNHKNGKIIKFAHPNTSKIVLKPSCGTLGNDIKVVKSDSYIKVIKKSKKSSIAEEFIKQHNFLNDIYSESVNTLRILTLKKNRDILVIKGTLKVGRIPNVKVDNVAKGGIGINLDMKTGILGKGYTAYKYGFIEYNSHPKTNFLFYGKTVPFLEDAKNIAIEAHRCFPKFTIVGWDIALTETGPMLVEGNTFPNITGMQLHEPLKDKLLN
ncbi:hypothetical protein AYK24_02910 [Thermoplasmatales archaeon SG8-52-4]|nr:MAG: hypothetical protein AYK24_02910 [Thermoplasmatales archaeon SG8-52-4]